jgi:hypothetical protein
MADRMDAALAGRLARVALANIEREYPHHEGVLQTGPEDAPGTPRSLHPSFFGSLDWHSCVEMHWLLVRLLRTAPDGLPEDEIRSALRRHLAAEPLRAEAAFFARPEQRANERPYGWGWLLMLHHEAATWPDADAERWAGHLGPLAGVLVRRLVEWLPQATYPVRHGVHENSAFALSLSLPAARWLAGRGEPHLLAEIEAAAACWFGADRGYPAAWEPSGADFLSPALTEAELMASLLGQAAFAGWLDGFLPDLAASQPESLFTPAVVSDPTDGHIAHLHGLNLSRAWCLRRLVAALPAGDPRAAALHAACGRHTAAGLPHAVGSDYAVEHWLAVYAVLLLTDPVAAAGRDAANPPL